MRFSESGDSHFFAQIKFESKKELSQAVSLASHF